MELYVDGKLAVKGQKVTDFRGQEYTLIGWQEPLHSASSGRVQIKQGKCSGEYFPGVINAEFREVDSNKKR